MSVCYCKSVFTAVKDFENRLRFGEVTPTNLWSTLSDYAERRHIELRDVEVVDFYRASVKHTHGLAIDILSVFLYVRLSVCQTRVL